MVISLLEILLLFIVTFIFVGVLTPITRKLAISRKIFDKPSSSHKTHTTPVPYLGGVAIIVGVLGSTYLGIIFSGFKTDLIIIATTILIPALLLGIVGLWDDIKNLPPLPRFIAQSLGATVISVVFIFTDNAGKPTGSNFIDGIISVIWIVSICNSINFFDNLDGGASGTVAISSATVGLIALMGDQFLVASLAFVTSGATSGFLIWNKNPAKIYMGDAGSLFLGTLIGALTIRLDFNSELRFTSFFIAIFILAIPILDTTIVIISRIYRGISPFRGGQDHLSHRMINTGLNRKSSVLVLWSLSAFFALLALLLSFQSMIFHLHTIIFGAAIWIILFIYFFRLRTL